MDKVVIYLTDEGVNALRGSQIAKIGQIDGNRLTFEPGTLTSISPTATGYQVLTTNPHRIELSAWAVAGFEQSLEGARQPAGASR